MWTTEAAQELVLPAGAAKLTSVGFTKNGVAVLATDAGGARLAWETRTGRRVDADGLESVKPDETAAESGGRHAFNLGDRVVLTRRAEADPRPAEARRLDAADWHRERLSEAEQAGHHFAAAVHAAALLAEEPGEWRWSVRLRQHAGQIEGAPLPEPVREALTRPEPTLTEESARAENRAAWESVRPFGSDPPAESLDRVRRVAEAFPRGVFLNTLAVAEFRAGNHEAAVAAAGRSLGKTPGELKLDGPHPVDLAVLAMSHFRLGRAEEAVEYRDRLRERMRSDAFSRDAESRQFRNETNAMFSGAMDRRSDAAATP